MSAEWQSLARMLIYAGIILLLLGALMLAAPKFPWIGHLPGDILIRRDNATFYFPLATCLLVSLLLSLFLWAISRFR